MQTCVCEDFIRMPLACAICSKLLKIYRLQRVRTICPQSFPQTTVEMFHRKIADPNCVLRIADCGMRNKKPRIKADCLTLKRERRKFEELNPSELLIALIRGLSFRNPQSAIWVRNPQFTLLHPTA